MRRLDVQHHTPEQVSGYVEQAVRIVRALPLNDQEAVAVLPTIVTLLASKSVQLEQDGPQVLAVTAIPGQRH